MYIKGFINVESDNITLIFKITLLNLTFSLRSSPPTEYYLTYVPASISFLQYVVKNGWNEDRGDLISQNKIVEKINVQFQKLIRAISQFEQDMLHSVSSFRRGKLLKIV